MSQTSSIGSADALFEFATEGILVTNRDGEITRINPAAERMFGYESGELNGKKIELLIPSRFSGKHIEHRSGFAANPHPRNMGIGMDLFGKRKDNSEFPVEISLSPFHSGEEMSVIAFIIDITIRKANEDAIKKQKEELERLTRFLKISNAELENFAYISSHDLQEPLRKIQSFGDRVMILEGDHLSEKGKDYLQRMLNASARMQNLINDLLAFSRLSTRAQVLGPVDLNQVLQGVLSDLEVTIEKTGARVQFEKLPLIEAEPTQMRQLFQNLVSNSIKFGKEGVAPEIKISLKKSSANSSNEAGTIELVFEDNGIGFDEKYLDKIFAIFQRLEGRKYEGSGIGLAICKKIALRHGGDITAKSKPGIGSSFTITLPLKQKKLYYDEQKYIPY